jgi:hypothetical protein
MLLNLLPKERTKNMNRIIKSAFFVLICSVLVVACKQNTNSTDGGVPPQPANNTMKSDTFVHPAVPANPKIVDGMNITRWPNGKVKMQGNYKDGKRQGEWQSFFESGKINSDEFFVDGQTNGKVTVYYENGKKRYEGENNNGKLSGVWNYWDEKGKLTRSVDYSKQSPTQNP